MNKRKAFLLFEVAAKSWESPTFQKTTGFQVSRTETKCQVPRTYVHTPFYMECDVMLMVDVRMSWTQWQESL